MSIEKRPESYLPPSTSPAPAQQPEKITPPAIPPRPSAEKIAAAKANAVAFEKTRSKDKPIIEKDLSTKKVSKKPPSPKVPRPQPPTPRRRVSSKEKITSLLKVQKAAQENILPSHKIHKTTKPPQPIKSTFSTVQNYEDEFRDLEGNLVATEQATLVNTKDLVVRQLNSKIDYLKKLQADGDKTCDKEIEEVQRQLDQYKSETGTWASTNAPRFAFEAMDKAQVEKRYMPALGNFWIQTIKGAKGEILSRIGRSAAITDFVHGRVSLKELEDYGDLVALMNKDPRLAEQRAKDLFLIYNLKTHDDVAKLVAKLNKRIEQDYGPQVKKSGGGLRHDKLTEIISSRKDKLRQQILQDLFVQFQANPVTKRDVVYGRTALVDSTKKANKASSGFINSERTQMLDMHAIYEDLSGKKIYFDVEDSPEKGPYFDKEGNIHMNRSLYRGKKMRDHVTLHTAFFNISAQGNTRNIGMQKAINDKALAKLRTLIKEGLVEKNELDRLENLLSDPKADSFETSLAATRLLTRVGYGSENCFGGKDRTGYAVAMLTRSHLEDELAKREEERETAGGFVIEGDSEKQISLWDKQLIREEGIASQVIQFNTGHKILKLTKYDLSLYDTSTGEGRVKRVRDMFEGVKVLMAPKVLPEKAGIEQQLYYLPAPIVRKAKKMEL